MQELVDYVRNNRDTVRTVILNSEVKGAFCVGELLLTVHIIVVNYIIIIVVLYNC